MTNADTDAPQIPQVAAVIGAGTMGHGIAHALSAAKVRTRLYDVSADAVEQGLEQVRANLDKGLAKGKTTTAERDTVLACLMGTQDLAEAVDGAQIVIEAVPENLALKQRIFTDLGSRCGAEVLLASNTSSLPLSEIAKLANFPERVLGMHFFNPVHIMKLVEVVRAEQTSPENVARAMELARAMGKDPIEVKDSPGFASSRLGLVIGLEAMRMLEEGVAGVLDIDKAMTLGYGFPMGPLRLTDLVGLDVRLAIAEHLERELGPRFAPPQILRQKVAAGDLGKKSGRGFYDWTSGA
ncbi:MAG TPA: 3-hydroxyacyl-CoA dehydrogenase family protein [Planctomycetota bacterium]|nr:3-hydroxyacyl-CoA dehydrogenase family protein [Planctomycetota bacterium]